VAGVRGLAVAAALWLASWNAYAQSASTSLDVSADVSNSCTISTTALAFGTYDTLSASPTDGTADVIIT
jgi:spore coat protein U-like protein